MARILAALLIALSGCGKSQPAPQGPQFINPPPFKIVRAPTPPPKPGAMAANVKVEPLKLAEGQRVKALGGLVGIIPPGGWSTPAGSNPIRRFVLQAGTKQSAFLDLSLVPKDAEGGYQLYGRPVVMTNPSSLVTAIQAKARTRSQTRLDCQYLGDMTTGGGMAQVVLLGYVDPTGSWGVLHVLLDSPNGLIVFRYTAQVPVFGDNLSRIEKAIRTCIVGA